jgi:hypothetical protein
MNLNKNPRRTELQELFAACDDTAGHHVLWVSQAGEVKLTLLPEDLTPLGWGKQMGDTVKFRYETFQCGNDYVGQAASEDKNQIDRLFASLKENWAKGVKGYIDLW